MRAPMIAEDVARAVYRAPRPACVDPWARTAVGVEGQAACAGAVSLGPVALQRTAPPAPGHPDGRCAPPAAPPPTRSRVPYSPITNSAASDVTHAFHRYGSQPWRKLWIHH